MKKELIQKQIDAARSKKRNLKKALDNRNNYLKKEIQTNNENYQRQVQSLDAQIQRLMILKRNCSK